jgi:hypothetical protein
MQYYIGIVTGAILLLGALGILGFGKRMYDVATREVIQLDVPIFGRIRSSSPFIIFAFIGFTLIIVCTGRVPAEQFINIDGSISTQKPVDIYFVAVPLSQYHQDFSGSFHTRVPKINDAQYRAKFVIDKEVVDDKELNVVKGQATLPLFRNQLSNSTGSLTVLPDIRTTDEQAKAFLR